MVVNLVSGLELILKQLNTAADKICHLVLICYGFVHAGQGQVSFCSLGFTETLLKQLNK